jgi:hypothetical protein
MADFPDPSRRAIPWRVFFVTGAANTAKTSHHDSRLRLKFLRDEMAPALRTF